MRILYGLCGEGRGHAIRSKVVIDHLRSHGHEVLVAAPDQGFQAFTGSAPALEIGSSRVVCTNGGIDVYGMLASNLPRASHLLARNIEIWHALERYDPNLVVTDHSFFAWLFARCHDLPVLSIDNSQVLIRCDHDERIFGERLSGVRRTAWFTELTIPNADHYLITTFFYPRVKAELRDTTTLLPPILRPSVVRSSDRSQKTIGESERYLLVYKTPSLDDSFIDDLAKVPNTRFVVYGAEGDRTPSNVLRRGYDEDTFIRDLAGAEGVVSNGGMTLMGEALALGKPVYAVPMRGQYEQVTNACYLSTMGYGVASDRFQRSTLEAFLERLPRFRDRLLRVPQHDANRSLYASLDRLIAPARASARAVSMPAYATVGS